MPFPLGGLIGGMLATRLGFAATSGNIAKTFVRGPLVQGGQFGVGYTTGSYGGYGVSNTWDPLGIHTKSYKPPVQQSLGIMPYGNYGYGRRRYRRRYGRYGRRSRYGYRRRSYYRRYY